jgi:hypothetical protein
MTNEIELANYWEHFKYAKDLAMVYPKDNPTRLRIEKALSELQVKLNLT